MTEASFSRLFEIRGGDIANAGRVSTEIKDLLKRMGIDASIIRRVAIASYEAEMNVVMYARRAMVALTVTPGLIALRFEDEGPGIPDIEQAMLEGFSTATPEMREMGFGAGMGLPNIRRNSDEFSIDSTVGRGTRLSIRVNVMTR
jgi:anti-sigma regulatory factor (Ser/Thr protein kinase)